MKKLLLIMAAALMMMTQCRKQETMPVTPSAGRPVEMTVTVGPGAKTDITDEGVIKWTSGDKLYVSDGTNWLGSLDIQSGVNSESGTFKGDVTIGAGKTYHFFYLGKGNVTTTPSGTTAASISFASQDGSREGALKYHLGHGSADVTVSGGVATGAVAMRTEMAIAHINLIVNSQPYTGSVTMTDVSSTMTVSPDGSFSGGDGIAIGNNGGTSGDRYVTLIPTGTSSVDVSFSGSATGSMKFGQGIQANNLYGMADGIEVELMKVSVTDVNLNKTSLSLEEGKTETLTATVAPDNATYKDVTWSSSDETKATVDQNGVVTAVAAGEATITVTTVDDDKTATCTVTVTPAREYVDLGLPSGIMWATCNVGAENPEDFGWYFMWGSVTEGGDNNCNYANCPGNGGNTSGYDETAFNEWKKDNLQWGVLKPEVDTAHVNWGGDWRMPTGYEWQELYNNTTSTWTAENGVSGRKFTSTKEGYADKSIFLPAAGVRYGTDVGVAGSGGGYWSSSLVSSSPSNAYFMYFDSGSVNPQSSNVIRYYGFSVRPVQ